MISRYLLLSLSLSLPLCMAHLFPLAALMNAQIIFLKPENTQRGPEKISDDEELMREAGLPTKPASLVAYFRTRVSFLKDKDKLPATVRQLGSDDFAVREQATKDLLIVGHPAIALLREHLHDADKEVATRARRCLEQILPSPSAPVTQAAIHLLAAKRPRESVKALLAYFPFAEDDQIEDEILRALESMIREDGDRDAITQLAAAVPDSSLRSVAAHLVTLGIIPAGPRSSTPSAFLADRDACVRFFAARAALQRGNPSAIPALISVLDKARLSRAWEAEGLLRQIAGPHAPAIALQATKDSRSRCREAWTRWWRDNRTKLNLPKIDRPLHRRPQVVYTDLDEGHVWATDLAGKELWRIKDLLGPVDVQVLPSGRILVAENHAERVTERDLTGKIYWAKSTAAPPLSSWRLPNGNTVIATKHQIQEVSPEGAEKSAIPIREELYSARPLRSGWLAIRTVNSHYKREGAITIMSTERDIIDRFRFVSCADDSAVRWAGLTVLPNGHYLVPQSANGEVVELDCRGGKVRECFDSGAICAARLPGGAILLCIVDNRFGIIHEMDHHEIVHKRRTVGRPWHVQVIP